MTYDKEDCSKEVIAIFTEAEKLYEVLKEYNIRVDLSSRNRGIISSNLTNSDKKSLSIFLSMLLVDNDAKNALLDFNITIDTVTNLIYDENSEQLFTGQLLQNILKLKKVSNSENDIRDIFQEMVDSVGYLSSESLLVLLYDSEFSTSNLINLFLPSILNNTSPFTDGRAFYEMFVKKSNKKEDEKIDTIPLVKEKSDKLEGRIDSFPNFFDFPSKKDVKSIKEYGTYLTDLDFESNPAIGREKELQKIKVTLLTQDKSLILVGPGGVGKTALVEGLAYDIKKENVPENLKNKKLLSINVSNLVSGCEYVGSFESVVEKLFNKLEEDKDTILFIDEIHTVFGLGAGSASTLDFANILKPYLDRGKIKMIGATTPFEYEKIVSSDSAFKRRFERLDVKEPTADLLTKIMNEVVNKFERTYNIKFFPDNEKAFILKLIESTTEQAKRIYSDKTSNPDLVILILEKAFAYAAYNEHKTVTKEDVILSIMDCDRIYESVRQEAKDTLNKKLNKEKIKTKVINFADLKK